MCTVTYIPAENSIFLTSNRDEHNLRADAIYPAVYGHSSGHLLFPKDAAAGGTWISIHENGNAVVLLNGGIVKHEHKPPYRRSRGLILLDLIDSENPFRTYNRIDLQGIEPFTVIILDDEQLYECRWDGARKYSSKLDNSRPYIWSSVTLYPDEVIAKRENWFRQWLLNNPSPTQQDILRFHQFTGDGDMRNDLLMNRDGEMCTVSVTSIKLENAISQMHYLDLKNNKTSVTDFKIKKIMGMLK
jgi:uncharacterized protein with NRDE domain